MIYLGLPAIKKSKFINQDSGRLPFENQ